MIISSQVTTDMEGEISKWPIVDMLMWLHDSHRSVLMRVDANQKIGWLTVCNGTVMRCEYDGLVGKAALFALLSLTYGYFNVSAQVGTSIMRNIYAPTQKLLLQHAIKVDERAYAKASAA